MDSVCYTLPPPVRDRVEKMETLHSERHSSVDVEALPTLSVEHSLAATNTPLRKIKICECVCQHWCAQNFRSGGYTLVLQSLFLCSGGYFCLEVVRTTNTTDQSPVWAHPCVCVCVCVCFNYYTCFVFALFLQLVRISPGSWRPTLHQRRYIHVYCMYCV